MVHIAGRADRAWGFFWALPDHLFSAVLFFIYHLHLFIIDSLHFLFSNHFKKRTFIFKALLIFSDFFFIFLSFLLSCRSCLQICYGFCHHFTVMDIFTSIQKCSCIKARYPISVSSCSASVTLSSSILLHPLFSSSPPASLHLTVEHRYLFRNLSVEIILHLRLSLSTHNYHGQSCRTALNSSETLMTLLAAGPSFYWR